MARSLLVARLRRVRPAEWLVFLAVIAYAGFYGWLAIRRHQAFQSSAMDLGYTVQALWNTAHGRPFMFTTYQNAPVDLPIELFRRSDILLAYHVEPLLLPFSLLFRFSSGTIALLWLQAAIVACGALPLFWLARRRLGSDLAGAAFALAYLLAPAVEGATLSDFHTVSLTAAFLAFALYFLEERRTAPYLAFVALSLAAREDLALLVSLLGIYACWRGQRRLGLITLALGASWLAIVSRVILPHFSGLRLSPFVQRLAIFGPTIKESLARAVEQPAVVLAWIGRREIAGYIAGLLASGGFLSLFSPALLAVASPLLAVNVFSNWEWTYSEGAHYSAAVLPVVLGASIYGLANLAGWSSRRLHLPRARIVPALAALMLAIAGYHHWQAGVSPLSHGFSPPRLDAHTATGHRLLSAVPPDAAVSAQAGLYPHVAERQSAYLFPAVNDAEYVFLDVASSTYPVSVEDYHTAVSDLLVSGFGVAEAEDGYLLLRRGHAGRLEGGLLTQFLTFAEASGEGVGQQVTARFGDALELVGYDYSVSSQVNGITAPASVITYWRALRPIGCDYRFVFFFTREDGAIVGLYDGATPTTLWRPTSSWPAGEVLKVQAPPLPVARLHEVLLAVTPVGSDPWDKGARLRPEAASSAGLDTRDDGTLLRLFAFR